MLYVHDVLILTSDVEVLSVFCLIPVWSILWNHHI